MLLLLMNATFLCFYYMHYLIWDDMRVAIKESMRWDIS
jgi:hypothetical protein